MADLGDKHTCADCDTRYYDLGHADATCPKCGSVNRVDEDVALASTLGRRSAKRTRPDIEEPDEDETSEDEAEEDEELMAELEEADEEDEDEEDED